MHDQESSCSGLQKLVSRAKILYNHMHHSSLPRKYLQVFFKNMNHLISIVRRYSFENIKMKSQVVPGQHETIISEQLFTMCKMFWTALWDELYVSKRDIVINS